MKVSIRAPDIITNLLKLEPANMNIKKITSKFLQPVIKNIQKWKIRFFRQNYGQKKTLVSKLKSNFFGKFLKTHHVIDPSRDWHSVGSAIF